MSTAPGKGTLPVLVAVLAAALAAAVADAARHRRLAAALVAVLARSAPPGFSPNLPWQDERHANRQQRETVERSDAFTAALFDNPARRFPHGRDKRGWEAMLREADGDGGGGGGGSSSGDGGGGDSDGAPAWCYDLGEVVLPKADLRVDALSDATRARARRSLASCGFVYLDDWLQAGHVARLRSAYDAWAASDAAAEFAYPVIGDGRTEHVLPFAPPFNDSSVYAEPILRALLESYLGPEYKLDLMTVIRAPPGAGDQSWHQDWRYLFHPDEVLPPYALVLGLPLGDVDPSMGPTEFCAGKKRRYYYGWRCERPVRVGSTAGSAVLFDYNLLHRGSANRHASLDRAMLFAVFSRPFFANNEALANRAVSATASLHMRRYAEQFYWHPP